MKTQENKYAKELQLPNAKIVKIFEDKYYEKLMQQIENDDVDMEQLENIFTDKNYYLAMKNVPLIEKKILYLLYVEGIETEEVSRRLNLRKKKVMKLKEKGIHHFKDNLEFLSKIDKLKKGGNG